MSELSTANADDPVELPDAFRNRISLLLVRVGNEIAVRGEHALLEAIGISGRDYSALAVLADERPGSQAELARRMGKAPALCVPMLDDLEAAGLATRERDPDDRRRSIVTITAKGRAILAKADVIADQVTASTLDGLGPDEFDAFRALAQGALQRTTTVFSAS